MDGLCAYLMIMQLYLSVFTVDDLDLGEIIERLATVVFFCRIWNRWLKSQPGLSVEYNGLTYQTYNDLELSCANVINVLSFYPDIGICNIVPNRMGTDIVETFW